jgi:hypothetical protein
MTRGAVVLCLSLFGMMTVPAGAAPPGEPPLRVFDAGELAVGGYTVVKRLWVDTWRSAWLIPTHDSAPAAMEAIAAEAARLGADGIMNLYCARDSGGWRGRDAHYCYALAIRLK